MGCPDAFKSPRLEMNRKLSEAAFEIHAGDLTLAVAMLLKVETLQSMPSVYRDNLVLLVRAYEKAHDHAGALLYLGSLSSSSASLRLPPFVENSK